MKTVFAITCLSLFTFAMPRESTGQGIAVVNARILDGKGGVIERGSVVVRRGKIVSVSAGAPASTSETRGQARSMVLIDGNQLIDLNDLLQVVITIKDGRIVSDSRATPSAAVETSWEC